MIALNATAFCLFPYLSINNFDVCKETQKERRGEAYIVGGAYVRNTIFFGRQMGLKPGGG